MISLVNFCLLVFIVTCNSSYSTNVDTLLRKYVSLISEVHKYYGTSSIFFIFSRNDRHLQEDTLIKLLCREFSRKSVFTLVLNFDTLNKGTSLYLRRIVRPLIVIMLKSASDINEFTESSRGTNKAYPIWLVIFIDERSKTLCEYCDRPTKNIFDLKFDTEMLVLCCNNPVLQEWWSIHPNHTKTADFATWTEDKGLTLLVAKGLWARRRDVDGAGIRVAIVTKSTIIHDRSDGIGGFGGTVLNELRRVMNFTITRLIKEDGFGSFDSKTKTWTGVVGHLAEGSADLGVAEFTMTNSRLDVVDFTVPLMIARTKLFIRVPDGSGVRWYSYLEVFGVGIWMALVVLLITTPIVLALIKAKKCSHSLPCLIVEHYLHVWGIFCQEGMSHFPTETPLRIAYVSIFITAVVVSASYSASLISFLTVSPLSLPFSTLEGFAADKTYKLTVIQNSSNYDLFATSADQVLGQMMKLMVPWNDLPRTLDEGFGRVCNGKIAFYTDEVVKKTMTKRINCKLAEIDSGRSDNLAMILSPKSPYTGLMNYHIERFKSNGMLNRLKHKYFLKSYNTAGTTHSAVGIWSIVPILSVLSGGIILAVVILFCEKIFYARQVNRRKWSRRMCDAGALPEIPNDRLIKRYESKSWRPDSNNRNTQFLS